MPGPLPVPDYDQLPLGSLRHRIRSLEEPELRHGIAGQTPACGRT
ncbi:hypothetical protein [Amycolatopsis sp. lyj-23]